MRDSHWRREWGRWGERCFTNKLFSFSCSIWGCVCVAEGFTCSELNEIWVYHMESITSGAGEGADYTVTAMKGGGLPWQNAESCWWSISVLSGLGLSSSQQHATSWNPLWFLQIRVVLLFECFNWFKRLWQVAKPAHKNVNLCTPLYCLYVFL